MECQALQRLLKSAWWLEGDEKTLDEQCASDVSLTAHLSSCSVCQEDLAHLSKDIFAKNALTCEECCSLLPNYYEDMYPLDDDLRGSPLSTSDIIEVTIHLNSCDSCRTSYLVLTKLWNDDLL